MASLQKKEVEDCESQPSEIEPLLAETRGHSRKKDSRRASYLFDANTGKITADAGLTPRSKADLEEHGIQDSMTYSTPDLITWSAFFSNSRTVWLKADLWYMMLRLTLVALVTGIITVLIVPNPATLRVAKFTAVSKFLNVIVGLLLGFFLSSSMQRWHSCVDGYMGLLNTLRNLHIQFLALGVREEDLTNVLRYGYASAFLLYEQLKADTEHITTGHCDRDEMWTKISSKLARLDKSGKSKVLTQKEISCLRLTHDPPHILWTWVGVLLGGLAQEGWIPPMNSPTYGRIMNLCQGAHEAIRQVKVAISVQAPLTYVHTLATLVHINNLLNAVTMGIVGGLATGTALIAHDLHFYKRSPVSGTRIGDASMEESERDWQNVAVTFCYCCLGPVLYQGLLLIAMYIAQPFQADDATVPMTDLLRQLEIDLCDSRDSVSLMQFKMPFFKAKEPVAVVTVSEDPDDDKHAIREINDDGGE